MNARHPPPQAQEYQYLNLLSDILGTGTLQDNRTGTPAWTLDGGMMAFDLAQGFPILTTKKVAYERGFAEMIGFLRAYDNADQFAALGCNWWYDDANKNSQWLASPHRKGENDLGRIYGVQWRKWRTGRFVPKPVTVDIPTSSDLQFQAMGVQMVEQTLDQVQQALDMIRAAVKTGIASRRIIINAWRPDEFDQMALPPCHVSYEFVVDVKSGELHMSLWQRSCDMFLGVPMNIANGALMLTLFAAATGLKPRRFRHFLTDIHIYQDHVEQVREQLSRLPKQFPTRGILSKQDPLTWMADDMAALDPKDIMVWNYHSHPAIKGKMSTA